MTEIENNKLWGEYFYPNTDILINNFNEMDKEKLKTLEATYSFKRLLELRESPINLGCTKDHLNAIHKYVFNDVYPFAGQYRKVNMRKAKGTFFFIDNQEDLEKELDRLFISIEERLKNCQNKIEFCEIMASLYTSLIYYHPYREGNGRAIREFLREFSIQKSHELNLGKLELNWSKINSDELNQYIEFSHIFPSGTAVLFMRALDDIESIKKK